MGGEQHVYDRERKMNTLRALADRLEHNVTLTRNGDQSSQGQKIASELTAEVLAVRWALEEIAPFPEVQGE